MYVVQYCYICHAAGFTGDTGIGIEPRTVATLALTVRYSNHSARRNFAVITYENC